MSKMQSNHTTDTTRLDLIVFTSYEDIEKLLVGKLLDIDVPLFNRKTLNETEVEAFSKYADNILFTLLDDSTELEKLLYHYIYRWKRDIINKGYTSDIKQVKRYYSNELSDMIIIIKKAYEFDTAHCYENKIKKFNFICRAILINKVKAEAEKDPSELRLKTKTEMTDEEIDLFKKYTDKLAVILYRLSGNNSFDKILVSTMIWIKKFIENGYPIGKRYKIITSILEHIAMIKIYYDDMGMAINKYTMPLEEELTLDPIYIKFIKTHPKYDYNKL